VSQPTSESVKTAADNTISRIIQMVEEAQERKGRSQRFIERFGARYSPAVLFLGVLIAMELTMRPRWPRQRWAWPWGPLAPT
jgi:cation transport ATPase